MSLAPTAAATADIWQHSLVLRGVIFNDAGVGLDKAGIGALDYLQRLGMAAATVAHTSARIGDGADMFARGQISHCNITAKTLGCAVGKTCQETAEIMQGGKAFEGNAPAYEETRKLLREMPVRVIACDSASLVKPDDADAIIITGSHGGRLAGRPGYGLAVQARGAVFNDAGVGIDMAGIQRLEILDQKLYSGGNSRHHDRSNRRCTLRMGERNHFTYQQASCQI